jgi:protein-tyrosine-phosphatase
MSAAARWPRGFSATPSRAAASSASVGGLGAMDGQPPTHHSVQAMREIGIDISGQRSRALTAELVRSADLILGMTHSHVDTVALLYPSAAEKTFLLREFDETLEPYEKDISDPIGSPYHIYVECRDQIEQGIVTLLKFMEQHNFLTKTENPPPRRHQLRARRGSRRL